MLVWPKQTPGSLAHLSWEESSAAFHRLARFNSSMAALLGLSG